MDWFTLFVGLVGSDGTGETPSHYRAKPAKNRLRANDRAMQKRVVVTAGTTLDNRVATRFDSPKERKH
jgi:hypothetical protein